MRDLMLGDQGKEVWVSILSSVARVLCHHSMFSLVVSIHQLHCAYLAMLHIRSRAVTGLTSSLMIKHKTRHVDEPVVTARQSGHGNAGHGDVTEQLARLGTMLESPTKVMK